MESPAVSKNKQESIKGTHTEVPTGKVNAHALWHLHIPKHTHHTLPDLRHPHILAETSAPHETLGCDATDTALFATFSG